MIEKPLHICIKLVFVALIVTSIAGSTSATKITVDANDGADYTSIQEAINVAKSGDTIYVRVGVYFGSLNITKKLTLQGEGEETIVHGNFVDKVISVYADGVEIRGFNVTGCKAGGTGIYLKGKNNVLQDNVVMTSIPEESKRSEYGIYLNESFNSAITGNIVSYNRYGIYLSCSIGDVVGSNVATSNEYGIYVASASENTLENNTANFNEYGIRLRSSSNNIVRENTANSNRGNGGVGYGISLSSSPNNFLINNTANSNFGTSKMRTYFGTSIPRLCEYSGYGIHLSSSPNNILINNTVNSNRGAEEGYGIYLSSSNNSNIVGNIASSNSDYGIYLSTSADNILKNNNLTLNKYGIYLSSSPNNSLIGNTANLNSNNGIYLSSSSDDNTINYNNVSELGIDSSNNNLICRNNLFGKTSDYYGINAWDDGREGNYWGDYTGEDANNDGIGDTPYTNINTNYPLTIDDFPLMKPVKTPTDTTTPSIIERIKSKVMPSPAPTQTPEEPTPSPTPIPPATVPSAPPTSPSQRNVYLYLMLISAICAIIIVIFGTGVGREIFNRIISRIKTAKRAKITIERAIYDPCKHDFIERSLPRMKEWINRYDPSAYWLALSIQNNTNKTVKEWSVELKTSDALKIEDAKIEGIEIGHTQEAHLGFFKISVPEEYGITIPKKGAQRAYFKLRAEKPKTVYEIKGVFKSAVSGDVQIRQKEFKYLCDAGMSPEAVKAELEKAFSEKDAVRLALAFKTVQELDRMCNQKAETEEYLDKLKLLKEYMETFSDTFTKQVDEFLEFMVQEKGEYLQDEYKEKVRRFCTNLVDVWISEFLKG